MKNSEFLALLSGPLEQDEYAWFCLFRGDPASGKWSGASYTHKPALAAVADGAAELNSYACAAVLKPTKHGEIKRGKEAFARLAVLVADDMNPDDAAGAVSYVLETSPGNYQVGIWIDREDPDASNLALVDGVLQALTASGKVDKSGNNPVRYVRMPVGSNGKPSAGGFRHRLLQNNPDVRLSLADACAAFGLNLDDVRAGLQAPRARTDMAPSADHTQLIAALTKPDPADRSYHDPLLKMTGKLVFAGLHPGAVVEHVRGLMLAVKPDAGEELARWADRYAEIPRMVDGAVKRRQQEEGPPVTVPVGGLLLNLDQLEEASLAVRWAVKGLVPTDSMGMIFGASGTFKSFVALDMCLHLAHGMRWADRRTTAGGVVYVAAEGGAGIARRVRAWHKERDLEYPAGFAVCVTPLLLAVEDQVKALRDSIKALAFKPAMIVVDTLSQTFSGDENSATDISDYLRLINTHLRAEFQASVLVVHHTGHSAAERPRGSSAITANLDYLLGCFRPDPDAMSAQIEVIKQKDGEKAPAQYFDLKRIVLGTDEDGDEVSSLVALWCDRVAMIKEAEARMSPHEEKMYAAIDPGVEVDEDELKALFNDITNADSRRKAFARAITKLQQRRLIRASGIRKWRRA